MFEGDYLMSMKMDRRTFLKTTAAAAVAVSMTGLLGGCSGTESATAMTLYGYKVDIDIKGSSRTWGATAGSASTEGKGYLRTTVRLTAGSGVSLNRSMSIFSATTSAGDTLTLENQNNPIVMVQNVPLPVDVSFSTTDRDVFNALDSGATTLYLDIAPLGSNSGSAVRYVINFAEGTAVGGIIQKD